MRTTRLDPWRTCVSAALAALALVVPAHAATFGTPRPVLDAGFQSFSASGDGTGAGVLARQRVIGDAGIEAALRRDGAWSPPALLPHSSIGAGLPVTAAAAGHAAVAWLERRGALWVAFAGPGTAGFAEPSEVTAPGSGLRAPAVAMASNGDAVVAVLTRSGSTPAASRRAVVAVALRRGGRLGAAQRVGTPGSGAPSVAMSPDGAVAVAWCDARRRILVAAAPPGGTRLSVPRVIGRVRSAGATPVVALGPHGTGVIAYVDVAASETIAQVLRTSVRRNGRFGAPTVAMRAGYGSQLGTPVAAAGPQGDIAVAWQRITTVDHARQYGLLGLYARVFLARAAPAAGLGRPLSVSGARAGYATRPALAVGPGGAALLGWRFRDRDQDSGDEAAFVAPHDRPQVQRLEGPLQSAYQLTLTPPTPAFVGPGDGWVVALGPVDEHGFAPIVESDVSG